MLRALGSFSLILLLTFPFAGYGQYTKPDSVAIKSKTYFLKNMAVPVSLIGLGILGSLDNHVINIKEIREERTEYFPNYSHQADNYLQFAPIPAVFMMDAFGFKATHPLKDQLVLFGQAQLIMMGMVYPMKSWTKVSRPDNSSSNSFPSGHTAQAFVAAHLFQKEFGRRYPWASVGMYTIASGIAVSRVLNNRHWASDVFAGAGIGMASVELSYLLGPHHHNHHTSFQPVIIPSFGNGAISCSMVVGL